MARGWRYAVGGVAAVPVVAIAAEVARYQRWYAKQTTGLAYFGRTAQERAALHPQVVHQGRHVVSALNLVARMAGGIIPNGVRFRGTTAPPQCGRADFKRAVAYRPRPEDVFVVTQMKCGTTWMMQLVYEVAMRGGGDLSDTGGRHIYGVSSWVEASWAAPLDATPRLGPDGLRMIKSHLPASLMPMADEARYVYVTRHPQACFASCVAFVELLLGTVTPSRSKLLDWFCSDRMWWGAWPDHVASWWQAAQERPNVLFVHFEETIDDLADVVDRVAAHLGVELTASERSEVVRKSGFAYMKEHEERFTMAPPTAFQTTGAFLRPAGGERAREVDTGDRERIAAFCRDRLRGTTYPVARFYPDLLGVGGTA